MTKKDSHPTIKLLTDEPLTFADVQRMIQILLHKLELDDTGITLTVTAVQDLSGDRMSAWHDHHLGNQVQAAIHLFTTAGSLREEAAAHNEPEVVAVLSEIMDLLAKQFTIKVDRQLQ